MTTRLTAAALIPMCMIASLAFAQMHAPSAQNRASASEASQPRAVAVPVLAQAPSHADADARACLEFVSNIGVIRCAEKYRRHSGAAPAARQ